MAPFFSSPDPEPGLHPPRTGDRQDCSGRAPSTVHSHHPICLPGPCPPLLAPLAPLPEHALSTPPPPPPPGHRGLQQNVLFLAPPWFIMDGPFWLPLPWSMMECSTSGFPLWSTLCLPLWSLMECSASGRPRPNVSQISCLESGMG